ncbi:MAG: carbohydrate kinase family protein [candidate division Zixibacteria bacterium]|nr:carbohydrate kinase family protein [candidate division Zixibacteria bacterium]
MAPLKIAVLGSINEDFIVHQGATRHSYGGILYNLTALSLLLPDSKIRPVAFLGTNVWPRVKSLSQSLKNIHWDNTRKLKRPGNRVNLFYLPNGEKREILKHPVPEFAWPDLKPALRADALLFNFISGWEVSPKQFRKLRENFAGLVYVDIHSLLLGIKKNGERFPRVPKDWDVFLNADYVQMNRQEWELVAAMAFNRKNLLRFCRRWKSKGWRGIIVTLAEKGAVLAYRDGAVQTLSYPAPKVKRPEQTGAGDFFAAGFISAILKGKSLSTALKNGVRTASWKCRYAGIEDVLKHRQELASV